MPSRYFFHAPDGRIYGPVSVEALRRWREAGRLRADSRLRAEGGDDVFRTLAEVEEREAALPPAPEPPPAADLPPPPPIEPSPAAPPRPPTLRPPQPLASLVSDAARLAKRAGRFLWPVLLVMQVPMILLIAAGPYFHFAVDPQTKMLSWQHSGVLFLALIGMTGWQFLFNAFFTLALRDLREGGAASVRQTWHEFAPRIGELLWTFFLAACILLAWGALTLLLLGTAMGLHGFLRAIVLVTAILSAVPTFLLALRCLILPQTAVLEGRRGFSALRRVIELVRLSSRNTLFSDSDLRLFALGFLCCFALPVMLVVVLNMATLLLPPERLLVALLLLCDLVGSAAITLFSSSVFLHFFEDVRRRLRDAGVDPS